MSAAFPVRQAVLGIPSTDGTARPVTRPSPVPARASDGAVGLGHLIILDVEGVDPADTSRPRRAGLASPAQPEFAEAGLEAVQVPDAGRVLVAAQLGQPKPSGSNSAATTGPVAGTLDAHRVFED